MQHPLAPAPTCRVQHSIGPAPAQHCMQFRRLICSACCMWYPCHPGPAHCIWHVGLVYRPNAAHVPKWPHMLHTMCAGSSPATVCSPQQMGFGGHMKHVGLEQVHTACSMPASDPQVGHVPEPACCKCSLCSRLTLRTMLCVVKALE